MKKDPKMLTLRLDPDLRHWITAQKGLRNKTETYIATELMIQGLRAQTVDELVDSIRAAANAGMQREILRQTLAMRYIIEAQARGGVIVDGLGMLLHQAVPGFARWFGVTPAVTPALRARLEADIVGV